MNKDFLGSDIKKLGFGLMRLPNTQGKIDLEKLKSMVDTFMEKGFTYFDTAYVYHGGESEVAAREALVKRYPRESFQLATKLPVWEVKQKEDLDRLFNIQLERTGAGYFDFYLLHALGKDRIADLDKFDMWGYVVGLKAKGLVKHAGFSFHDKADVLDEILTKHPEMEIRPASNQLCGLGRRGRTVPRLLRSGHEAQQARHHHGTGQGRESRGHGSRGADTPDGRASRKLRRFLGHAVCRLAGGRCDRSFRDVRSCANER